MLFELAPPLAHRRLGAVMNSMATNMLALRKAATILIGVAIGSAAVGLEARAQPYRPDSVLPDLTVLSVRVVPPQVASDKSYELEITVANTMPPASGLTGVGVPRVDPRIPFPKLGGPAAPRIGAHPITTGGANVLMAELIVGCSTCLNFSLPRRLKVQPRTRIRCAAPQPGRFSQSCQIGPLRRGGRWTITAVFPPLGAQFFAHESVPYERSFSVIIDPRNVIAERDEWNNSASAGVEFFP
jgi:hypothetical protein